MRKYPRILFFILASMPTDKDFAESEELGPNVAFRNASLVSDDGALEQCDGVAGKVPKRYADACPPAREAIEKWMNDERERRAARAAGKPEPDDEQTQAAPAVKAVATPPATAKPTPKAGAAAGWTANG